MTDAPESLDEYQRLAITVDIWKYVVSVQMHFNDMEMRIRNLYFTILAASLGLLGVVQGKEVYITTQIHVSIILFVVLALIPISWLFYFIDRHWYHQLLHGAVNHARRIELKYKDKLPEIQLGLEISKSSPVKFNHWIWKFLFFFIRDKRFREKSCLHSDQKIQVLYNSVVYGAVLVIIVYGLFGGVEIGRCALLPFVSDQACRTSPASFGLRGIWAVNTSIDQPLTTRRGLRGINEIGVYPLRPANERF